MITKIRIWQDDNAVWHYEYWTQIGGNDDGLIDEMIDPPNGIACDEWIDDALYAVCLGLDERRENFGKPVCEGNQVTIERIL